jgi:flagellar motility protein MotE (MotC chaperone)
VNVKGLLLRILAWLEHAAAALLVVILVVLAVLYFTKSLNRDRGMAIWGILRGEKVAVAPADHGRWLELDRQAASRAATEIEKQEQVGSGAARTELDKEKKRLDDEAEKERRFLAQLNDQIKAREQRQSLAMKDVDDRAAKLKKDEDFFLARKKTTNMTKILKLYAGMDAEAVAKDFENKLRISNSAQAVQARNEVVEILRLMPERQASEVLSAMEDSNTRNMLMDALRS